MKKTLQRIYYDYDGLVSAAGTVHDDIDFGLSLVDGWLTMLEMKIIINVDVDAGEAYILGVGIRSNPLELIETQDIGDALFYNDLYKDYLTNTRDASWYHGNEDDMPLFYILLTDDYSAANRIDVKKIFRKGIRSGDHLQMFVNKRPLEAASATTDIDLDFTFEHVISASNWRD